MNAIDETIDTNTNAELQRTCDSVAKGVPFSRQEQDAAMQRIERIREAIRKAHGVQNIAVDLIREARDSR